MRARVVNGIKKRGKPYAARQPSLRRENPEAYRQQKRAWYNAHKDEINAKRRREYAAQQQRRHMSYTLHQAFIELLPDKHETYHERDRYEPKTPEYADAAYRDKTVDIVPFREWLIKYQNDPDNTLANLGRAMGFADGSRLYKLKNSTPYTTTKPSSGSRYEYPDGQARVTLDLVDRCLIAAGADTMLWELYDVE